MARLNTEIPDLGDLRPFRSSRMTFRLLDIDDAPELQVMTDSPAITSTISFLTSPFSIRNAWELIAGEGDEWRPRFIGGWLFESRRLAVVMGVILHGAHELEVGFWVRPSLHRKGLAKEAMEAFLPLAKTLFPLRLLVAECTPSNVPAVKVLNALGFVTDGATGRKPPRSRFELTGCTAPPPEARRGPG
ncbi:N-acetyltransferase GCN5 [Ameyamaea chiangmaiensis NBRC 103196]|uniref:GNAT family N-acetyltransferase n=1 Tax=Ameyamaea chiangmaiensis TaxID=442969 RepID=A0A850PAA1_9PROT|nr:GNAT family N-acetyltransferase [Ameyamaea chiangmaiensis]MBS4074840.1 GNAT family N-acetyltransferase [Ameyamaea chiangmaiensis]NVN41485.1 GNAT family N-acetyltransferase [Ameyamaea chiangmaiensis]GBQ62922.1 N-acetyltransferase GCN5 [Ameyamaea chiangmaiensis NBRC 103196]